MSPKAENEAAAKGSKPRLNKKMSTHISQRTATAKGGSSKGQPMPLKKENEKMSRQQRAVADENDAAAKGVPCR